MKNIETKKFIAIYLSIITGILAIIAFIQGTDIPSNFITLVAMIISFYFGKGSSNL